jgi:nitrous oxidase accessory protein NosD
MLHFRCLVVLGCLCAWPAFALGATVAVGPGQSIQAAIDAASDGDVVTIEAAVFNEDLDFHGKAITVVGAGPDTVIVGTGTGPVVRLSTKEPPEAVLDSVTITGGVSGLGGGIYISGSSPTIVRTVIMGNSARFQGSAVYIGTGSPQLLNNLIIYNTTALGDPHSVEIVDAAPLLLNNTIARGDSNGIILRGSSAALIMNNMIVYNGSVTDGTRRGRGICDFSGGLARIHYNVFARNRIGALLTNGKDYRRISRADAEIGAPRLEHNVNGPARLAGRASRDPARASVLDFRLRAFGGVPARDAGNPDGAYDDLDGSRNDIGVGGGPLAPAWAR